MNDDEEVITISDSDGDHSEPPAKRPRTDDYTRSGTGGGSALTIDLSCDSDQEKSPQHTAEDRDYQASLVLARELAEETHISSPKSLSAQHEACGKVRPVFGSCSYVQYSPQSLP